MTASLYQWGSAAGEALDISLAALAFTRASAEAVGPQLDENPEKVVDVVLAVEMKPRARSLSRPDADGQQLLGVRGRKRILVGGIVADVHGAVAREPSAR